MPSGVNTTTCPINLKGCKSSRKNFTKVKHYRFAYVIKADNFANQMKKIAAILLIIFTLVQAGPAIQSLVNSEKVALFIVDEEKNNVKENPFKDSKKDFCIQHLFPISNLTGIPSHVLTSDPKYASHIPENLTPPPNS
jgi:hypothetical protein